MDLSSSIPGSGYPPKKKRIYTKNYLQQNREYQRVVLNIQACPQEEES